MCRLEGREAAFRQIKPGRPRLWGGGRGGGVGEGGREPGGVLFGEFVLLLSLGLPFVGGSRISHDKDEFKNIEKDDDIICNYSSSSRDDVYMYQYTDICLCVHVRVHVRVRTCARASVCVYWKVRENVPVNVAYVCTV